jgi:histone H3/H4
MESNAEKLLNGISELSLKTSNEDESEWSDIDDENVDKYCIPKQSFQKLVREIACNYNNDSNNDLKFQPEAMNALQEVAEQYLIKLFNDTQKCADHAKRETITTFDMQLVMTLRKNSNMTFELEG